MKSSKIAGKDITGLVSGRLTVLYQIDRKDKTSYYWHCQCECGETTEVVKPKLTKGRTGSCGCSRNGKSITHGYSNHPLYKIFMDMKGRCYNRNYSSHLYYGGRGIIICDEWLNSPGSFVEWAESNGYKKGLEIDRIDNEGNYEPNNCRFVTRKENANNRRTTVYVLLNGERILAVEAATKLGITPTAVRTWNRQKRVSPRFQDIVTLIED